MSELKLRPPLENFRREKTDARGMNQEWREAWRNLKRWILPVAVPMRWRNRRKERSSASREEKFFGVGAPSLDGLRANQAASSAGSPVAHQQGIAIGEVRRNFAVIGNRNEG